jgi:hypothetical protein
MTTTTPRVTMATTNQPEPVVVDGHIYLDGPAARGFACDVLAAALEIGALAED